MRRVAGHRPIQSAIFLVLIGPIFALDHWKMHSNYSIQSVLPITVMYCNSQRSMTLITVIAYTRRHVDVGDI